LGKVLIIIVSVLFLNSANLFSQSTSKYDVQKYEIGIEEFMGMFDGIFSDNLIDEITFNLPDELTVVNYSVADFTGDGYLDVGIVYKDKTCAARTFKVILLENIENRSFKKVLELDANWRDTPFDVGFAVEKNNINIVFRRNKNWIFAIYTMDNNKLKLLREEIY